MICKASITSALDVTCTLMSLKESLPVAVFMGRSVGIMQAGHHNNERQMEDSNACVHLPIRIGQGQSM